MKCQVGKQIKSTFRGKEYSSTRLLNLVHTDLCGSNRTRSFQGERYFMLLIDDYSRWWVAFLIEKFEELEIFNENVENKVDRKIKCLSSDRGGEFILDEFNDFCEKHGIRRQLSASWTPQHNGVVERMNWTIQEVAITMMKGVELPKVY